MINNLSNGTCCFEIIFCADMSAGNGRRCHNGKIIVADDEMLIRRLVCDFLIKEGHTPLEAADGKMAVELFNQIQTPPS